MPQCPVLYSGTGDLSSYTVILIPFIPATFSRRSRCSQKPFTMQCFTLPPPRYWPILNKEQLAKTALDEGRREREKEIYFAVSVKSPREFFLPKAVKQGRMGADQMDPDAFISGRHWAWPMGKILLLPTTVEDGDIEGIVEGAGHTAALWRRVIQSREGSACE